MTDNIAAMAYDLVTGDRNKAYGSALANFTRLGRMWGAILHTYDIPPEKVALMLVAHKIARESNIPKHDNRVDMIGYTVLMEQIIQELVATEEVPFTDERQ